MPELGTSGSVRRRDGQPPSLLELQSYRKVSMRVVPLGHSTQTIDHREESGYTSRTFGAGERLWQRM